MFYDSDGMGAQYTYGSKDQRPWYKDVIARNKLRILIYSGDTDTCVNTLWSQWWTSELGIPEQESWRGWTMDNETAMAGYVTRYANDFDFLTVRGAGHMVPQMQVHGQSAAACEFGPCFDRLLVFCQEASGIAGDDYEVDPQHALAAIQLLPAPLTGPLVAIGWTSNRSNRPCLGLEQNLPTLDDKSSLVRSYIPDDVTCCCNAACNTTGICFCCIGTCIENRVDTATAPRTWTQLRALA